MTYTKEQLIQELGLDGMPAQQQEMLLNTVYSNLNLRVIGLISDKLDDNQLTELNKLIEKNDDTAVQWIESNVPDYVSIIENEAKTLIEDLKSKIDKIASV